MTKTGAKPASVDLRILPFFYQTPLFVGLSLLAGAGLISGIFKWRVLRIRRLNQELEANVRIRTREVTEQKELLAQTNLELQALQNTSAAISGTLDKVDLGRLDPRSIHVSTELPGRIPY